MLRRNLPVLFSEDPFVTNVERLTTFQENEICLREKLRFTFLAVNQVMTSCHAHDYVTDI